MHWETLPKGQEVNLRPRRWEVTALTIGLQLTKRGSLRLWTHQTDLNTSCNMTSSQKRPIRVLNRDRDTVPNWKAGKQGKVITHRASNSYDTRGRVIPGKVCWPGWPACPGCTRFRVGASGWRTGRSGGARAQRRSAGTDPGTLWWSSPPPPSATHRHNEQGYLLNELISCIQLYWTTKHQKHTHLFLPNFSPAKVKVHSTQCAVIQGLVRNQKYILEVTSFCSCSLNAARIYQGKSRWKRERKRRGVRSRYPWISEALG